MRAIYIPALVALGIGLAGTSPTVAAPAKSCGRCSQPPRWQRICWI